MIALVIMVAKYFFMLFHIFLSMYFVHSRMFVRNCLAFLSVSAAVAHNAGFLPILFIRSFTCFASESIQSVSAFVSRYVIRMCVAIKDEGVIFRVSAIACNFPTFSFAS